MLAMILKQWFKRFTERVITGYHRQARKGIVLLFT